MIKIQPAPILIESSETKTSEIINLMISKKTSYVLLLNEAKEISGIFTDRDVLRLFHTLSQENFSRLPILNYMNKPVTTLDLNEIHLAPNLMAQKNFRHVPIVHNKQVVGIVTADSIFKSFISQSPHNLISVSSLVSIKTNKNLAIVSPDGSIFSVLKSLYQNEAHVLLRRIWYSDLQVKNAIKTLTKTLDLFVLDIDDMPLKNWLQILSEFAQCEKVPDTFLFLDQEKYPSQVIEKIEELKSLKWLHIYYKPLNITQFLSATNEVLLKK